MLRPGKICREVYLPRGVWYDLHSGARLNGPQHVLADARLDMPMPLYARGGAIIPSGPAMQWSDQHPLNRLTLDIYLDDRGSAEGSLYEDDGQSYEYESGQLCRTSYRCEVDRQRGISSIHAQREGSYVPARRSIAVRLHHSAGLAETELPIDTGEWRIELAT